MIPMIHRKRVSVCTKLWGDILKGRFENRGDLVKALERLYEAEDVEPLRGKTKINIYDKEMATLYLVGKYGLGIMPDEYSEVYEKFFYPEIKYETVYYAILNGRAVDEVFRDVFGYIDENLVFRVIRLIFTGVVLGFDKENNLLEVLRKISDELPKLKPRIDGFLKFYIAFRIAEKIAAGEIRSRLEKEALKHSLCVKFNAVKSAPPDQLIREIAVNVLKVDEYIVNRAFKVGLEISLSEDRPAQ